MSHPGLDDVGVRLRLRKVASRRRLLVRIALAAVAALVIAGVVWAVGFSTLLAARTVTVSGTRVLTKADVVAVAAVPTGTPLVWIDPGGVADRVAGLPPVDSVSVTRAWPNAINIAVTERTARLAIAGSPGYLIADGEGVVFRWSSHVPPGLVRVEGDPEDQQVLVDVGVVYSALSKDIAARVTTIVAGGRDSIALRLRDGTRIFWGSAEESDLKAQVVERMIAEPGTTIDVSAPSHPSRR